MIQPARVDVRVLPGCTLYLRGEPTQRRRAVECAWARLAAGGLPRPLAWCRTGTETQWKPVGSMRPGAWLDTGPCRRLQACSDPAGAGAAVEIVDLDPVLGQERASSISIRLPGDESPDALAALARWALSDLPLWWGTAGWFFVVQDAQGDLGWDAIAAAAKRHWAVQIADAPALQWDAIAGLPSIGWITLVGHELAQSAGVSFEQIASMTAESVYVHRGRFGVACAAGAGPVRGDIHRHEPLAPYRVVDTLLQPLLLKSTHPWRGAFARADLRQAWIARFAQPQAWLDASLAED